MRFEDVKIASLNDLIRSIYNNVKIGEPVWYRGQANKSWKLLPSLIRIDPDDKKNLEMDLIKKFKQDATLLINRTIQRNYQWLFIMRHYDIPTRLLDWTESPLIAAYFAVQNPGEEGVIWALSPISLNKQEGRELKDSEKLPAFDEDSEMVVYEPESYNQDRSSKSLPIAFIAPRNTERMKAQSSTFVIYHRDTRPLEEIGDKMHIWRYIIPKENKERIKKELELVRINKFQIFPELEVLGKTLKDEIK